MPKRTYTHMAQYEAEIFEMRQAGRTRREIAEHFGLSKEQVKGIYRHKPATFTEASSMIDDYIHFYHHERI